MFITKTKHGRDYIVNGYKVKPEVFGTFVDEFFTGRGVAKIVELLETQGYVIVQGRNDRIKELEEEIRELKTGMAKQEALPF